MIHAMSRRSAAGRKSIGQPEQIWGRVSAEVRSTIEDLTDAQGVPMARIVAALVEHALADLPNVKLPGGRAPNQEEFDLKAS